jgi:ankyrin repeat protein
MMRFIPTLPYITKTKTVTAGILAVLVLAALVLGGSAEHKYLPGSSYTGATDVQKTGAVDVRKYSDDWFAAARAGRTDILQALVDAHFPLEAKTSAGYTALILSAYDAKPEALKLLLSAGANACAADRSGNTALMGALFKGETNIAKSLLDTHCGIDQVNNAGETALSFAALFGRLDMLPVLVAHGANPNHVDARGGTALQMAINQHNSLAADALRRVGATQ